MNDKTRASLSSNARWSFRASFVKVIKTENSLYLVQSAHEMGPTSYETPCILKYLDDYTYVYIVVAVRTQAMKTE